MHSHHHAFTSFNPLVREGLVLRSRRNFLKASLAGMAGLSVPHLLEQRALAVEGAPTGKSVILLWMTGGPSHIETWDPKPDRPIENRGPFGVTRTKLPGVLICEHLPKMAAQLDRYTLIRSVDARGSNHEPDHIFQTGNLAATPRTNPQGHLYPAIGSVVAKMHGPNQPGVPAYATFMKSRSHLTFGGWLGKQYDPFPCNQAARLPICDLVGKDTGQMSEPKMFALPAELSLARIQERRSLSQAFDGLRSSLDTTGSMDAMDRFGQQAVDFVLSRRVQNAFDLDREPQAVRDRYGKHLWCQQALLTRRLVEAGCAFVTLDLSYHTASGTWDTHGDNIPPYGGIKNGLGPLLPLFDHLLTTLIADLDQRGLLDRVLVIAMGEFGRTPLMGTQGSTDGRNHWPEVLSMALAGGGFRHGQVIGATTKDGGYVKERPVTPGDLAATIYHHFGVPLDAVYHDHTGRPRAIVENGKVIGELV
jgi:hypothetical protein